MPFSTVGIKSGTFPEYSFTVAVSLSGWTTWEAKAPMGDHRYAAVPPDHVQPLFREPTRPYVQVGIVFSLGGCYTADADNYRALGEEI